MVDVAEKKGQGNGSSPAVGKIPNLAGDIRHLIPPLGLRESWYPIIAERKVPKRRPTKMSILGDDIAFFRGSTGQPVAITDICPHRGARISEGHVHWKGTVACPYHGFVFDENGKNVAVLSEGPESKVCGKPGTEAKVYPTQVLKGVVFIWMGAEEPAPIEEDVPSEFFDPKAFIIFNDHIIWPTSWLVALENSMDSHVGYLHRDNLQALLSSPRSMFRGASGFKPVFTGNGFRGGDRSAVRDDPQDFYPNGWTWPKHRFRRAWAWMFAPFFSLTRVESPELKEIDWWGQGHRLPGMFRAGGRPTGAPKPGRFRFGGGGLFGLYTRWPAALEPWKCRLFYFHWTEPKTWVHKIWYKFLYNTIYRWLVEYNFSRQDASMMFNQRYDAREKLSGHDAEVIQWRKLVVTRHYGGRGAEFMKADPEYAANGAVEAREVAAPGPGEFGKGMTRTEIQAKEPVDADD